VSPWHVPVAHIFPAQHGWPVAPHASQTTAPPMAPMPQMSDAPVHFMPAQQASPAAPHMPQVPPCVHMRPDEHASPVQHG
jgi:hypothetical protein